MLRRISLALLATAALSGCVTDYGYRSGAGDYYYGRPSVEYYGYDDYYYGYGAPYGSISYGYYPRGWGYYGYPNYYGYPSYYYPPYYWRHHRPHRPDRPPPTTSRPGPIMSNPLPPNRGVRPIRPPSSGQLPPSVRPPLPGNPVRPGGSDGFRRAPIMSRPTPWRGGDRPPVSNGIGRPMPAMPSRPMQPRPGIERPRPVAPPQAAPRPPAAPRAAPRIQLRDRGRDLER